MAFMGADGQLQKTVKLPKEARAKWVAVSAARLCPM